MTKVTGRRVCIFSQRGVSLHVSRCCGYEFEDIIAGQFEDADVIAPTPGNATPLLLKVRGRLARMTPLYRYVDTGLKGGGVSRDYDLFFFNAALSRDLLTLGALGDWRKRCGQAVCWIQELWVNEIDRLGPQLEILNEFDHVYCAFAGTVDPLRARLDVPVTNLPWGVDTELFCPWPRSPERSIDFQSISRMSGVTHGALLRHAREAGLNYDFPTIDGVHSTPFPSEHRWRYADRLKRSRYFFAYLAKVNQQQERGAQIEFGSRYVEGVAGGTVVLGDRVATPAFEENFGWADSVIEVPFDCPDIARIIGQLDAEPERLAAARRSNVINSLKRHDHLYRWEVILDRAGLAPSDGMRARRSAIGDHLAGVEAVV